MKLIDYPRYYNYKAYNDSIQRVVNNLVNHPSVLSIYQVGGVSTPGISDIDLWVVFKDGESFLQDPLVGISSTDKYFFIHNLFGLSKKHFFQSQRFKFFHDFKLLYGKDLDSSTPDSDTGTEHTSAADRQAALEYLLKMYIVMTVERQFRVVKVRGFLLHAKALLLDLAPLGLDDPKFGIIEQLEQVISIRKNWFSENLSKDDFLGIHEGLYVGLEKALWYYFSRNKFEVPLEANTDLGSNIIIEQGSNFGNQSNGIGLPAFITGYNKRLFNLQRRLMKFKFKVPMVRNDIAPVVKSRFDFIIDANEYNSNSLPNFIPVPYGLSIFRKK